MTKPVADTTGQNNWLSYIAKMDCQKSNIDYTALFNAVATGDEAAFKMLFELYKIKLYAVAFKWTKSDYDAEEITQEIFIGIWNSRAKLADVSDPQAYIYTAAYNKVKRYLKTQANQERILQLVLKNEKKYSNETDETILAADKMKFINSAIAQLSSQKKLVYDLSRNHGKSYEDIAETLHLSKNTVKTHLSQAVKFVRNYVKTNALLLTGLLWLLS